jgi:peptidase E
MAKSDSTEKRIVIKPIMLLSDSQLLFWQGKEEGLFLRRARTYIEEERPNKALKAAYIGASNEDQPEYYDIFVSAMKQIDITDCRHITSSPVTEDFEFLTEADLILLAGGDIKKGWEVIQKSGLQEKIVECYYNGALLIGVSAGAVQLGMKGWKEPRRKSSHPKEFFTTFQVVPIVIDVHDEENSWERLSRIVRDGGQYSHGLGIPAGGGAVYHTDGAYEAVRHTLTEFFNTDEKLIQSLILPPKPESRGAEEVPKKPDEKALKPAEPAKPKARTPKKSTPKQKKPKK